MNPAKVILISLAIGLPVVILANVAAGRAGWGLWIAVAIVLSLGIVGALFLPGTGDQRERPARFERSALLQSVRLLATLAFLMPMLAFLIFAILFGELWVLIAGVFFGTLAGAFWLGAWIIQRRRLVQGGFHW